MATMNSSCMNDNGTSTPMSRPSAIVLSSSGVQTKAFSGPGPGPSPERHPGRNNNGQVELMTNDPNKPKRRGRKPNQPVLKKRLAKTLEQNLYSTNSYQTRPNPDLSMNLTGGNFRRDADRYNTVAYPMCEEQRKQALFNATGCPYQYMGPMMPSGAAQLSTNTTVSSSMATGGQNYFNSQHSNLQHHPMNFIPAAASQVPSHYLPNPNGSTVSTMKMSTCIQMPIKPNSDSSLLIRHNEVMVGSYGHMQCNQSSVIGQCKGNLPYTDTQAMRPRLLLPNDRISQNDQANMMSKNAMGTKPTHNATLINLEVKRASTAVNRSQETSTGSTRVNLCNNPFAKDIDWNQNRGTVSSQRYEKQLGNDAYANQYAQQQYRQKQQMYSLNCPSRHFGAQQLFAGHDRVTDKASLVEHSAINLNASNSTNNGGGLKVGIETQQSQSWPTPTNYSRNVGTSTVNQSHSADKQGTDVYYPNATSVTSSSNSVSTKGATSEAANSKQTMLPAVVPKLPNKVLTDTQSQSSSRIIANIINQWQQLYLETILVPGEGNNVISMTKEEYLEYWYITQFEPGKSSSESHKKALIAELLNYIDRTSNFAKMWIEEREKSYTCSVADIDAASNEMEQISGQDGNAAAYKTMANTKENMRNSKKTSNTEIKAISTTTTATLNKKRVRFSTPGTVVASAKSNSSSVNNNVSLSSITTPITESISNSISKIWPINFDHYYHSSCPSPNGGTNKSNQEAFCQENHPNLTMTSSPTELVEHSAEDNLQNDTIVFSPISTELVIDESYIPEAEEQIPQGEKEQANLVENNSTVIVEATNNERAIS